MPSRKLTEEQKTLLAHRLQELLDQSGRVHENVDFIRENAGIRPFSQSLATPAELLAVLHASEGEFVELAKHHMPIYLGQALIEEFDGHWSIEKRPSMAMFGVPYVDGFGNIDYEDIHLPLLNVDDDSIVERFERFRGTCRKASRLLSQFKQAFGDLARSEILRSELEKHCIDRDVLPRGFEAEYVWRSRVTKYAKLLKIKIKRG